MFSRRFVLLGLASALLIPLLSASLAPADAAEPLRSVGYGPDPGAPPAGAEVEGPALPSMSALVADLLDTIAQVSEWRRPTTAPQVSKLPRAEIERVVCGGRPCAVRAFYLPDQGVFLEDSLTPQTDLIHRSILFHELVHFVQEVNAEGEGMDACHRWLLRERQAYTLQNTYLASIGDQTSYRLMMSNQAWLTRHGSVCAARENAAGPNAAEARPMSEGRDRGQP